MNLIATKKFAALRRNRGLTLIDVMIVITIVGILAGQAIPSWLNAFRDKRMAGSAEVIASAINLARSQAVARNQQVAFSVLRTGSGASCHVVHTGAADGCTCADDGSASCSAGSALILADRHHASLSIDLSNSIRFDPRTGMATPTGTVHVRSADGRDVQNRVAITGRVRTCAVGQGPTGIARCPS